MAGRLPTLYLSDEINSEWQNQDAFGKYRDHFAPSHYLMPDNFGKFNKEICVNGTKLSDNFTLLDFHLFPRNFAWSMPCSHEDSRIS